MSTLPAVPDKIKGRIRRGEYIDLSVLLQTNITKASERAEPENKQRSATIANFESGGEQSQKTNSDQLPSLISRAGRRPGVFTQQFLSSFHPHIAPRLFQYQHFLTLKSRSFQTKGWLRYDTVFRLKLAVNNSWHFETVDTELWASCFAADGLTTAQPQAQACFSCGSTSHLYAACPHRRLPNTLRVASGQRSDNTKPLATAGKEQPVVPMGDLQEACFIYNDRGRCLRPTLPIICS